MMQEPCAANAYQAAHAAVLLASYRRLTGRELLPVSLTLPEAARELYFAPFVVLSHDGGSDPVFTYANLTAQILYARPWREVVGMPSRYSAEPPLREARQRLLESVSRQGFIDDYRGVRVSGAGDRFEIEGVTVWNLAGPDGIVSGQAATFTHWRRAIA
jgi:hypothetical protein